MKRVIFIFSLLILSLCLFGQRYTKIRQLEIIDSLKIGANRATALSDNDGTIATTRFVVDTALIAEGTPLDNQLAIFTSNSSAEGNATLIYSDDSVLFVGERVTPVTATMDPAIVISRLVDVYKGVGSIGNAHAFVDESNITRAGGIGYNSFDSKMEITGTNNFDHMAGFQARANFMSTGTISRLISFQALPTHSGGTCSRATGLEIRDPLGAGTINNNWGVYVKTLSRGGTSNSAIVVGDSDADQTLIHVNVTDNPKFIWDESQDAFRWNKKALFDDYVGINQLTPLYNLHIGSSSEAIVNARANILINNDGLADFVIRNSTNDIEYSITASTNGVNLVCREGSYLIFNTLDASSYIAFDPESGADEVTISNGQFDLTNSVLTYSNLNFSTATPDGAIHNILTYTGSSTTTVTDIQNPKTGTVYIIIGTSNTNTVTINDGGNFNLSANWTGGLDDTITIFVQGDNDYIELSRSDN
jgi:hypothetical protein